MTIQDVLDEIKVDYLESGHHHTRPGWIQLRVCPFCSSQNYHLGFNLQSKYFFCWRCRYHSAYQTLVSLGIPGRRAIEVLGSVSGVYQDLKRERSRVSLLEPKGLEEFTSSHVEYLASRGLDLAQLDSVWEVNQGFRIRNQRLKWRIYIPIIHHGIRVSWTSRAIGDRVTQRYVSASAEEEVINHKEVIYGGDYCNQSIVIVEGPVDAWKIGPGAGALFGTAFTSSQVKWILKFPYRFVCFDSSNEAQQSARALCDQLSCFPGVTENLVLEAKDPGEASAKEIRQIRKAAMLR